MQVIALENADEMGAYTADLIVSGISCGDINILGIATGPSPMPIYRSLAKKQTPQDEDAHSSNAR